MKREKKEPGTQSAFALRRRRLREGKSPKRKEKDSLERPVLDLVNGSVGFC